MTSKNSFKNGAARGAMAAGLAFTAVLSACGANSEPSAAEQGATETAEGASLELKPVLMSCPEELGKEVILGGQAVLSQDGIYTFGALFGDVCNGEKHDFALCFNEYLDMPVERASFSLVHTITGGSDAPCSEHRSETLAFDVSALLEEGVGEVSLGETHVARVPGFEPEVTKGNCPDDLGFKALSSGFLSDDGILQVQSIFGGGCEEHLLNVCILETVVQNPPLMTLAVVHTTASGKEDTCGENITQNLPPIAVGSFTDGPVDIAIGGKVFHFVKSSEAGTDDQ